MHSFHKEKHNFKEFFLKEFKKKKLYMKVFYVKFFTWIETQFFTEIITNKKFRTISKGGRVAIYCKKSLNPKLIISLVGQNTFTFESIAKEIQIENVSNLIKSHYRSNKYFSINNSSNHFEPFFNKLLSF